MEFDNEVLLPLSHDEALVLFDVLHRWEDAGSVSEPLHRGEQVALWNLSCALERVLVAPFDDRYDQFVSEANDRLAGE